MRSWTFFRCFLLNPGAYSELRTELFIQPTRVDYSNPVNPKRVQVLSYRKYSLLCLPVVRIEPTNVFT